MSQQPDNPAFGNPDFILQLSMMMHLVIQLSVVQVRQMFQSLSSQDRELQIQMGLDTLGQGNSFVARSISSFNPRDQTVQACTSHK